MDLWKIYLLHCYPFWAYLVLIGSLNQCKLSMKMVENLQDLLFNNSLCLLNIKLVPTTNKNPQANDICKCMHQTVVTVLKTHLLAKPPQTCCQAVLLVDNTLAIFIHALQSTVLTMFQAKTGGLAFSWDMFLSIPLIADWYTILAHRERMVIDTLFCANKRSINSDYQIGQKVFKYEKTLQGKLKPKTTWPFDILWVHYNGTLTICFQPGFTECVNFCCTLPYQEPTPL